MSKYGHKAPGTNDKEYQEALNRYMELTNDYSFQEKLHELSMLETILVQANCIDNIDPVAVLAKTSKSTVSIYVRTPYLDPFTTQVQNVVTRSVGTTAVWKLTSVKKALDNPDLRVKAISVLKETMQNKFLYPVYKSKFPKIL